MEESLNIERVKALSSHVASHQTLRESSLNLVASENIVSPLVSKALSSDLSGRYSSEFYGGSKYIRKIQEEVEEYAKELFECEYACIAPISGHLCDVAVVRSLTSPGDTVALVGKSDGGYPFQIEEFNRKIANFPFHRERWTVDYDQLGQFYREYSPELTILGASAILYPYEIPKVLDHVSMGKEHVVYDGSHVLGLIAGKKFQNPLKEGVPLLFGSTHKTFPGPQGGLLLGNDLEVFSLIRAQFSIQTSSNLFNKDHGVVLVDNIHVNRVAALGYSLLEMMEFGEAYADQIIRNTVALGKALGKRGLIPLSNPNNGYSQSHQLLIPVEISEGLRMKNKLEEVGIFIDGFMRIGTAEITRRGYKEADMNTIADFIMTALNGEKKPSLLRKEITEYCNGFKKLHYCFSEE